MDFAAQEEVEGLRFAWNAWPNSRIGASRLVVPLAVVVTPLRPLANLQTLEYEPVTCRSCVCVLNPYCTVDFRSRTWICPFCQQRNQFPAHYMGISDQMLPSELFQAHTAVEYVLRQPVLAPPAFLFVVDLTVCNRDELEGLKGAMRHVLQQLPDYALVGLITFTSLVHVHELGFGEMPRSVTFRGTSELQKADVQRLLGLNPRRPGSASPRSCAPPGVGRFLLPVGENGYTLESAIEELQAESGVTPKGQRPLRSTGAAVAAATALLEATVPHTGARILLFTSGPATCGPGSVVSTDWAREIRTHKDLEKGETRAFAKAKLFYEGIAGRLVASGHTLDVFACSLDQVGLAEMRPAVSGTGGVMVLAETYSHDVFQKSLERMFVCGPDGHLRMAFNASFEVLCSRELVVCGAVGSISALNRDGPRVAEVSVGKGGTTAWRLCSVSPGASLTAYLDVVSAHEAGPASGSPFFLQFLTHYQHASGQHRLRVVTTARCWSSSDDPRLVAGFDQEAAAVVMAQLAAYKAEYEESFDVLRWVDRTLIRLAAKVGSFHRDMPDSFQLPDTFLMYPQFMFFLRRSPFLQVFNNTPDETAFYRLCLERGDVSSALTMIQPTLLSYGLDGSPTPVLLDVSSIQPERILLLDTYFMVLIFYGSTVAEWRKAGFHLLPEQGPFRELLAATAADARRLLLDRMPFPKLLETNQGGSQGRFLLAKLNPSTTHASSDHTFDSTGEMIYTDDVSLKVFQEFLAKLAVTS